MCVKKLLHFFTGVSAIPKINPIYHFFNFPYGSVSGWVDTVPSRRPACADVTGYDYLKPYNLTDDATGYRKPARNVVERSPSSHKLKTFHFVPRFAFF